VNILKNYKCNLKGLDCANCAVQLENAIQKIDGVKNVSVNFMTGKLIFECNEEEEKEIIKKVKKAIRKEEPDLEVEGI